MANFTLNQLQAAGGKLWENAPHRRVYFNDLHAYLGLNVTRYNTGNISYAELDGEKISNGQARKMILGLSEAKVYYCLTSNKFQAKGLSEEDFGEIRLAIEERIQGQTEQA
jgi:hypothetical protein